METRPPRIEHEADRYRRRTERTLAVGGFGIVALVGGCILWLVYGRTAATLAIGIVLAGCGLCALLWLLLAGLEHWARSGGD